MKNVSSSNGNEKYPKLRFPEFTESWELVKAEDLFENIADKNHADETVLTIVQGKGTLPRELAGRNIQYDEAGLSNYKKVEPNDYIIHLRSFEGGLEMTNEAGIVSPAYTILRCRKPYSNLFYEAYFHTDEFINHVLAKSVEGIRDGRQISYPAFKWLLIPYCDVKEQEKISALLSVLNKRIQKQEELVEILKKYKRGLIHQIFNRKIIFHKNDGFCFPEWEECRLSDIASFHQGLTYSPNNVSENGTLVLRSSNIQDSRLDLSDTVYVNLSISESMQIQENDILMCVRNGSKKLVGKTAIIKRNIPNATWGAFMMIIRGKEENSFVYHYLNSELFYNQVFKDSATATINQITKGLLNECKLKVPTVHEQQQICNILDKIDEKLFVENKLLKSLIEEKNSMLQQLFI